MTERWGAMNVLTTDDFFGNSHIFLNDGGTCVLEGAGSVLVTADFIGSKQVGVLLVALSIEEGLLLVLNELSHCV